MILPKEVLNRVFLFNSHPTADMIRVLINKFQEVRIMRLKNNRCTYLSFYQTWRNIELDQVKIDKMKHKLINCGFDF